MLTNENELMTRLIAPGMELGFVMMVITNWGRSSKNTFASICRTRVGYKAMDVGSHEFIQKGEEGNSAESELFENSIPVGRVEAMRTTKTSCNKHMAGKCIF